MYPVKSLTSGPGAVSAGRFGSLTSSSSESAIQSTSSRLTISVPTRTFCRSPALGYSIHASVTGTIALRRRTDVQQRIRARERVDVPVDRVRPGLQGDRVGPDPRAPPRVAARSGATHGEQLVAAHRHLPDLDRTAVFEADRDGIHEPDLLVDVEHVREPVALETHEPEDPAVLGVRGELQLGTTGLAGMRWELGSLFDARAIQRIPQAGPQPATDAAGGGACRGRPVRQRLAPVSGDHRLPPVHADAAFRVTRRSRVRGAGTGGAIRRDGSGIGGCRAKTSQKRWTSWGSNWTSACRRSSATAASCPIPWRYGRSWTMASYASAIATIRAPRGMSLPRSPYGYPCPEKRS